MLLVVMVRRMSFGVLAAVRLLLMLSQGVVVVVLVVDRVGLLAEVVVVVMMLLLVLVDGMQMGRLQVGEGYRCGPQPILLISIASVHCSQDISQARGAGMDGEEEFTEGPMQTVW